MTSQGKPWFASLTDKSASISVGQHPMPSASTIFILLFPQETEASLVENEFDEEEQVVIFLII